LQEELQRKNSNAARYNFINGDGIRSLCNSPLAFTLGHEVRKAAYALSNLLPSGGNRGRMGALMTMVSNDDDDEYASYPPRNSDPCKDTFKVDLTLRNVDKVHIPSRLLRKARGIAIVTCAKGGLGFAGVEFGTGLVVARTTSGDDGEDMAWSAPSALGLAGFSWGALIGAQVSDHIFLLMTDEAVRLFSTQDASIQLGVDIGVAVGPVGRSAEADLAASRSNGSMAMAPIYTYSLSKGLYAGVSMDGRVVVTRPRVNEKFYGRSLTAEELLNGSVPRPPAAQPLYDAIKRCLVYGDSLGGANLPVDGSKVTDPDASPAQESGYQSLNRDSNRTIAFPGGLLERLSHSTGLGMPVAPPPIRTENPYNLAARHDPTWQPNFSE
jgi:lipid-binding SYLF domain-containing protein